MVIVNMENLVKRYGDVVALIRWAQGVLGDEVAGRIATGVEASACAAERFAKRGLTEREIEVVELIAQGLDNTKIAAALYMGEGTVRNHISAILQKLQLRNRTQIAILYYRV